MARTLLSFQPDNQDERLRQLLEGGQAPLADAQPQDSAPAPPEPDNTPQQDPGADTVAAQPEAAPSPTAGAGLQSQPQPAAAAPQSSREDQILQMLLGRQEQKDPAMEARWKQAEVNALDRADYLQNANQHYGLGEFARDNGAALVASILDVGFNKGRGLGGIVGATAQGVSQQEAARLAQAQQAREFALKIHQEHGQHQPDPVSQMLALGRLDIAGKNAVTGADRVAGTAARFAATGNPESDYSRGRVTQAGNVRSATTQAGLDVQHENNPRTAADHAAIQAADTAAQIQTQLGYAPQTNEAAAQRAGGEAQARVLGERAGQAENRPAPAGYSVTDDLRYQNTVSDPKERAKMDADATTSRQLLMASQGLAALRKQNGPQWLPSPDSGEYQALHLAVVGAANRVIADAGTLNAGERQYIEGMVPGVAPNWKDFAGWMMNSDLNAQQLEGFAKGLQRVIDSRMMGYGLGVASPEQTTPGVAPQQPRAARPYAPSQPGSLGGQQPVAPATTSRSGGEKVHVRMKTKDGWDEADVESDLIPYLPKGVVVVP